MTVTKHGSHRIRERCGLNKKSVEKIARKALEDGLHHKDAVGNLKKFLSGLYLSKRNANNMRIYNQKIFMFRNERLITVINLPSQFFSTVEKIKNRKLII